MKPNEVICLVSSICSKLQPAARDIVLLFARIMIGWSFFLTGKGKIVNLERTTGFFESLGIPAPGFHAAFVGGLEMTGGLLLVLGFLSRVAALPLAIAMAAAYLAAHQEEAFKGMSEFVGESPFAFLLTSLMILAFGPGRMALDAPVKRLLCKDLDHG